MARLWLSVAAAAAITSVSVLAYAQAIPADVAAALADKGRIQADLDSDALRKPADMVAFAGIKPGMKVVDISPGGPAYFTRIFSKIVGPTGKVYGVNNAPNPGRGGAGGPPGGGRGPGAAPGAAPAAPQPQRAPMTDYANVTMMNAPGNIAMGFTVPEQVDVVWTSRNYHDFKNASADLSAFNKSAFDALKPGGIFIVLDHAAAESDTRAVTSELHRIKESTVRQEVQAAGFRLVGTSDVLRNPADNRSERVQETDIRGRTDQFILKFQKPN